MSTRTVGTLFVDVTDRSDDDRPHFHAELAEESYAKCGLRAFTGSGGFDHITGEGDTAKEAVADVAKVLKSLNLTGTLKVRS
jgi:hypothetical protein